jgi:gluconokinase
MIVLMGVAGAGKSTVGALVAARLGVPFLDADDFHDQSNIDAMRAGIALDDRQRLPWLHRLNGVLRAHQASGVVLACSALKRSYRDRLRRGAPDLRLVFLKGDKVLILERLRARKQHFMPPGLLDSQFKALEEPGSEESPIVIDVTPPLEILMAQLPRLLRQAPSSAPPSPY